MREWAEGMTSHTPLAEKVRIERVNCGPLQADLIRPAGGDPSRLIIYYHGGGFFLFSPPHLSRDHDQLCPRRRVGGAGAGLSFGSGKSGAGRP